MARKNVGDRNCSYALKDHFLLEVTVLVEIHVMHIVYMIYVCVGSCHVALYMLLYLNKMNFFVEFFFLSKPHC